MESRAGIKNPPRPSQLMLDYLALKETLKNHSLPLIFVDLDRFDENVEAVASIVRKIDTSKRIRIASKSIRVPALIKRAQKSSSSYKGLMIYSAQELPALCAENFDDFYLAYPTLQSSDLKLVLDAHQAGKSVALTVDCLEHIQALATYFKDLKEPIPVLIDLDGSLRFLGQHLGVRRSPVRSIQQALRLHEAIKDQPQLKFEGFMLYEAQVAGLGDRNPFKPLLNPIFSLVRFWSKKSVAKFRLRISEAFNVRNIPVKIFNGGGSGSLNFTSHEKSVTEVTAGSAFYGPHLFDYFSNIQFKPSCFIALQAVRKSDPGIVTCFGGGYIASGEPGEDKSLEPYLPHGLSLISTEGCGEVQTPIQGSETSQIELGDAVIFRHAKAGEVMSHFNEVYLIRNGKIVGKEKTYRGLGLNI